MAVLAMMQQMEDDKNAVVDLCKKEILDMIQLDSRMCNMTYKSKFTATRVTCLEPKHMRISWMEDSGEVKTSNAYAGFTTSCCGLPIKTQH